MIFLGQCCRCGSIRDDNEIVNNYELCDECFEEDCPCNENNHKACPLHKYADIVLGFK